MTYPTGLLFDRGAKLLQIAGPSLRIRRCIRNYYSCMLNRTLNFICYISIIEMLLQCQSRRFVATMLSEYRKIRFQRNVIVLQFKFHLTWKQSPVLEIGCTPSIT